MSSCAPARIDELFHGELAAAEAAALRGHVESCATCARELQLLRAEKAALAARPDPPDRVLALPRASSPGLGEIRQRVVRRKSRDRAAARRSIAFAIAGAAAALLVAVQGAARPAAGAAGEESAELSSAFPWCGERPDPIGAVERAFSACLAATPRALPGSPAVCL